MHTYLVMVMRNPEFQSSVVAAHKDFLEKLDEQGILVSSGPFSDGSGGAYIMLANDIDTAHKVAFSDPLYVTGCSQVTLYEWQVQFNNDN